MPRFPTNIFGKRLKPDQVDQQLAAIFCPAEIKRFAILRLLDHDEGFYQS